MPGEELPHCCAPRRGPLSSSVPFSSQASRLALLHPTARRSSPFFGIRLGDAPLHFRVHVHVRSLSHISWASNKKLMAAMGGWPVN
eukprot:264541-Pleurochrysis_carterae.AAC.1